MKKCDLLKHQDDMDKAVSHLDALANLLSIAGGQTTISEAHQNDCMSLLCELLSEVKEIQLIISQGLTELYFVDNAVHGDSD